VYLHAAANGSRTYGRTGLKCQNGWHALCGMAPTLWSSIRHVDRRGNIARRERLCLWVLCVVSAGRYALFTKFDPEYTVDVHETRVIGIRGVWAGAAPRGRARLARTSAPSPEALRLRSTSFWTGPGTGPHPPRHAESATRACVPDPAAPPDITRPVVKVLTRYDSRIIFYTLNASW